MWDVTPAAGNRDKTWERHSQRRFCDPQRGEHWRTDVTNLLHEGRNPGSYQRVPVPAGCHFDGRGRFGDAGFCITKVLYPADLRRSTALPPAGWNGLSAMRLRSGVEPRSSWRLIDEIIRLHGEAAARVSQPTLSLSHSSADKLRLEYKARHSDNKEICFIFNVS